MWILNFRTGNWQVLRIAPRRRNPLLPLWPRQSVPSEPYAVSEDVLCQHQLVICIQSAHLDVYKFQNKIGLPMPSRSPSKVLPQCLLLKHIEMYHAIIWTDGCIGTRRVYMVLRLFLFLRGSIWWCPLPTLRDLLYVVCAICMLTCLYNSYFVRDYLRQDVSFLCQVNGRPHTPHSSIMQSCVCKTCKCSLAHSLLFIFCSNMDIFCLFLDSAIFSIMYFLYYHTICRHFLLGQVICGRMSECL